MDALHQLIALGVTLGGTYVASRGIKVVDQLSTKRWFPWVAAVAQAALPLLTHQTPTPQSIGGSILTGGALWAYRRIPDSKI